MDEARAPVPEPAPTAPGERLPELDALRGLALLGVVAVNAAVILGPERRFFAIAWADSPAPAALAATHFLFAGKAYALLAFLFGAGLSLQGRRLGPRAAEVLPRRLGALAILGAAHGLLLWSGDILAAYATVGAVWLAFLRDRGGAERARWAAGLLVTLPVLLIACGAALSLAAAWAPGVVAPLVEVAPGGTPAGASTALAVYGSGSLARIFVHRAGAFVSTYLSTLFYLPQLLGLFLVGGWAVERGLLEDPTEHGPLLARLAWPGLLAGGAGEVGYAALASRGGGDVGASMLAQGLHAASAPALALGGAAALLALWSRGTLRGLLALAPLGRLALTAYLLQSLLFTTLAYPYGGGLYGGVTPDVSLGLAAACWALQAALAPLYLARFRSGPAEWAWRRLTYRR